MQLVEVYWIDSVAQSGWHYHDEFGKEPLKCKSVGYLLSKTKTAVVLVQSQYDEINIIPRYGEALVIPASCVRKLRNLKDR